MPSRRQHLRAPIKARHEATAVYHRGNQARCSQNAPAGLKRWVGWALCRHCASIGSRPLLAWCSREGCLSSTLLCQGIYTVRQRRRLRVLQTQNKCALPALGSQCWQDHPCAGCMCRVSLCPASGHADALLGTDAAVQVDLLAVAALSAGPCNRNTAATCAPVQVSLPRQCSQP